MDTAARVLLIDQTLLAVWLSSERDPPQPEFDAGIDLVEAAMRENGVRPRNLRTLVVTDGGAPSAKQRKQLSTLAKHEPSKSAVITTVLSNPIKRGIATALSWTNPAMRFFQPDGIGEALRHLELLEQRVRIWAELQELQKQLPANETLGLIARALRDIPSCSERGTA